MELLHIYINYYIDRFATVVLWLYDRAGLFYYLL